MNQVLRVFVYGTLKPGERNYSIYCENRVIEICRACTQGHLYHLSVGYPAMTPGDGKVEGYLLTLAQETVLEELDRLEGYSPKRSPQENEYIRQQVPIYTLTGDPLGKAWSYIMTPEKVSLLNGVLIASGWWMENRNE